MKKYLLAFALAAMSMFAAAQQIKVATGSPKGTYHALFTDIAGVCGNEMAVIGVNTSGSLENIDKLTSKEVGAAFVQTDSLFASAQGRDLGNVKTLVAFNREMVHVLTMSAPIVKPDSGMFSFKKETVTFNTAEDLKGYRVAAAGGSIVSAQLIKLQGQINWTVVPVDSADAAIAALKAGTVQAAVLVGGAPLGNIRALNSDFKLVGFRPQTIELLKTVYVQDKVSYPKLSTTPVSTVSTEALLVVRTLNTKPRLAALAKFRACILRNVPEFKDADGAHPAWAGVDENNKGKWAWYDLP